MPAIRLDLHVCGDFPAPLQVGRWVAGALAVRAYFLVFGSAGGWARYALLRGDPRGDERHIMGRLAPRIEPAEGHEFDSQESYSSPLDLPGRVPGKRMHASTTRLNDSTLRSISPSSQPGLAQRLCSPRQVSVLCLSRRSTCISAPFFALSAANRP